MVKNHYGIAAYDGLLDRRIRKLVSGNPKRKNSALKEIQKIKNLLGLRSEKSQRLGVFEELD
jgi:hypothetical protein